MENTNNKWSNQKHWREVGTTTTNIPIPTSVDDVFIIANMDVDVTNAEAASVTIKNGKTLTLNTGKILNCSLVTLENDNQNNKLDLKGTLKGNIVVKRGELKLNDNAAVVNGSITVESGAKLSFPKQAEVTGDIILESGATVDWQNFQAGEFGGTVIIEAGATVTQRNIPAFLNPSNAAFNSSKITYAKPIQSGWNFIGLPLSSNVAPLAASDAPAMWALAFNYTANNWDENYLHYVPGDPEHQDDLPVGNGIFVFLEDNSYNIHLGYGTGETDFVTMSYPYEGERSAQNDGRWFALANPYMKNLSISTFLTNNAGTIHDGVYLYNGSTFDAFYNGASESIIVGDGFFVNMADGQTDITFNYPSSAKSKSAEREFVKVSVATNGYKVPVMFAQNDDASDGYDIYDANKMFGDGSVAEPYLVCNGINLCKEEVSSTNYTATMNIKSSESRSVEIVADNIPEGYSLTLLDGAVEVEMSEGDVYTTDIAEGENAERFKLLINKNNVSIADVAQTESVRVVNNNRSIAIYGGQNVRTEVYNALGQKVYETSDRTFDLNNVAAGAYVLKVQDGKSVSSSKIVVE
ncbi:MAG: T9SS type A sorting domain-containing protein [Candidatus Onthomorpha sp.]